MEHQYLNCDDGTQIAYQKILGSSPGIIFLGGFMSDMMGTKASFLEEKCRREGRSFIRFDYYGHGLSIGDFTKGTIGRWKQDSLNILDQLTEGPQILIGSSMGGWLMLLIAEERKERIHSLIGAATAPDFTLDLKARLDPILQQDLHENGICHVKSSHYIDTILTITNNLIEEAQEHHLLHKKLNITCPVRLLHGMQDSEVPWQQSLRILEIVNSENVRLILVKDGDHRLSRRSDLKLLSNTVDGLVSPDLLELE